MLLQAIIFEITFSALKRWGLDEYYQNMLRNLFDRLGIVIDMVHILTGATKQNFIY